MSDKYKVGYGKPPKHTQFAKGESGNPKGRPGGTKNIRADLREELAEKIIVREGDRTIKISKQRGIIKSLVARTLKGDSRASMPLISLIYRILKPDEDVDQIDRDLNNEEKELLAAFEERVLGITRKPAGGEIADAEAAKDVEKTP